MSVLEALLLGILQGLTEFLPVSSSGHIELGKVLLGIDNPDSLVFTILVHGATVLSTIVIFRKDIGQLLQSAFAFQWNDNTQYILKIVISAIPVAVVGLLWEEEIEQFFQGNLMLVGVMLLVTATILYLTLFAPKNHKDVGYGLALIIGIAQTIAVMPGISRSGATIGAALLLGIKKDQATRFSFLMVLLPIIGATVIKVLALFQEPSSTSAQFMPMAAGFLGAFLAGLAACKWMIALVQQGKLIYFAFYCLIIGGTAIVADLLM